MRPDRHAGPQLELGNRLACPGHDRLLPGDRRKITDRAIDQFGVASRLTNAHIDHDLDQIGSLHHVGDLELIPQRGCDLLAIALLQSGQRALGG